MAGKIGKGFLAAFLTLTLLVLITALALVTAGGIYVWNLDTDVDAELFETAKGDKTTRLYYTDADGNERELAADRISGYENALYCPLKDMPRNLTNAFIAIEDKRFYEHGGIDWVRTGGAVRNYLLHGNASYGGSTITQQLIKNLTGEDERSISRKAAELVRAAKTEQRYSKEEILEIYLNVVNLSENCYGIRTAANAYFSKEPADLTLAECATIAAITNNPSRYDPIRHPDANRRRRDVILSEMRAQGMIDEGAYGEAIANDTELRINEKVMTGRINSWYADLVVHDVIRDLMQSHGMTQAEASRLVYCGGLKITTCVDPQLQEILEDYYCDPAHFPTHEGGKKANSSMMIVDPATGDILALAGAVGEKTSNRIQNYATDTRRPSGSVIKPLAVYAPALEKDIITYGTVFDDVPRSYRQSGAPWPRNAPNIYRGLTTVNDALTNSVNTISVAVLNRLSRDASFGFLTNELEFTSLRREEDMGVAALALGQQYHGVTLREVLGGFTALAGGGNFAGTRSYSRVLDRHGEVLLENGVRQKRVLSEDTAAIMTMMLRHVVQTGTGRTLTLKSTVDVAGKTGTSGNSCDKWFVGYTPELLAGVWYGYDQPESLSDISGNPALRIFDTLMKKAVVARGVRVRTFPTPGTVVAVRYCKDSGCLPAQACGYDPRGDRTEIGYFKKGTEPHTECTCHVLVDYCGESGVATRECPAESLHKVALLRVSREFPRQIYVVDAAYTYGGIPPEKGRGITSNEPYYAQISNSKHFYGIGMEETPYNRLCPGHADEDFWERRIEYDSGIGNDPETGTGV